MIKFTTLTAAASMVLVSAPPSVASAQICTPTEVNTLSSPRTGQLIHDGNILYAIGQAGLSVYLVSDPANPGLIATLPLGGVGTGHAVRLGDILYAANGSGTLHAIDTSDPAHPVSVLQASTNPLHEDLLAVGPWLVQANAIGEHQILDPATLAIVGVVPGFAAATNLIPSDDGRLWGAGENEIRVYDLDGAGQPTLAVSFPAVVRSSSYGIVRDGVLYVSDALASVDNTLSIIDVSDIHAPMVRSTATIGGDTRGEFVLEGSQLIVGTAGPVTIVDVTDPDDPFVVARFNGFASTVAPSGPFLYTGSISPSASLRVFDRSGCPTLPVIIQQPEPVLAERAGDSAQFSVAALLDGSYQWFRNGEPIADGGDFAGSTTPTLTVRATPQSMGIFRVAVTNPQGTTVSTGAGLAIEAGCRADLNLDNLLDLADVTTFVQSFLSGCP